ncbi:hypothetical protein D3Z45_19865 [Lachnospiraceae bacterium]|nr:hypothetical protein [Lachnospiraceae bacterium]
MASAGPSASAVRGTCRLTAASVPRFPWEIDILLSKTNTKNNAAKPTALVWTFWLSMAVLGSMGRMPVALPMKIDFCGEWRKGVDIYR